MFSISSDLFYGSPGNRNLDTPKRLDARILLKHRQTPLLSTSRTWKVFERQDDAISFAKARGNGLVTFVFHASVTGHRLFLVTHPREFWTHDVLKKESERCSYEVIPENEPCKLYLDLEFQVEFNPNHNGIEMTELFIKIIAYKLFQTYHLKVDQSMIIDLDSSTEAKFSRHLIYQIPMLCFASNYEVGLLVKEACMLIKNLDVNLCSTLEISELELKQLIVKDKHGREKLFCDEGVYTKNRHFRLYRSTKPRKNSHLVLSAQNKFTVHISDPKLKDEAIFLASLLTNFEPMDVIVPLPERVQGKQSQSKSHFVQNTGNPKNLPSPFPILDKFAIKEMEFEGVRCWIYFQQTSCLIYESYKPGYCGNIGRSHKSNKGMLIFDLRHNHYYRKCHDSDCFGYQSEPKSLPKYVIISLQNPQCSDKEKKEIADLLEFLEANDTNLFECESAESQQTYHNCSMRSAVNDMSLCSNGSQQSSFDDEIKETIEFLESQPELIDMDTSLSLDLSV